MSGPDLIWVEPTGYREGWTGYPDQAVDGDIEYVRRDPAVLAALPEVRALIAALKPLADESLFAGPQHGFVTVTVQHCDAARLALRAITEGRE